MPKYTKNLNLFKYDTTTDKEMIFDIDLAINENLDKIDDFINSNLEYMEESRGVVGDAVQEVTEIARQVSGDVESIETTISNAVSDIEGYKSDIEGYKEDIEGYKEDIEGYKEDIEGSIEEATETFNGYVNNAQTWVEGTDEEVAELGGEHSIRGYVDLLSNVIDLATIPMNLSDFTDDLGTDPVHTHSQYLTEHQDISGKEDVAKAMNVLGTSGTINLTDNSANSITEITGDIIFVLPTITDNTKLHQVYIQMYMPTAYSIDLGLGLTPHWLTEDEPDVTEAGNYEILYVYDKANQYWKAGVLKEGVAS